jgi:uncharacterized protein
VTRACLAVLALLAAACAERPVVVSPAGEAATTCPLEGCGDARAKAIASSAPPSVCFALDEAPCGGMPAAACTDRALAAWSDAPDDRAVACVERTLRDACDRGDPRACGFAGRMLLDGRAVPRDRKAGIALLAQACDDGERMPCLVAVRWLAESDHLTQLGNGTQAAELRVRLDQEYGCLSGNVDECFQVGASYSRGANGYPRSAERSVASYRRACDLGHAVACNNLADAMEYGSGTDHDLVRAAATYERSCRLGLPLGCGNLGYLLENGLGVARNVPRARVLYGSACASGENYACLHVDMMAVQPPGDPFRAVEHWERLCAARDARACTFVGVIYEDGPDGYARDETKSHAAMERGCTLGNARACEWVQEH